MQDRIQREQSQGQEEEAKEIVRTSPHANKSELGPELASGQGVSPEENVSAALREGSGEDELVEDRMLDNPSEKKRVRREQLAERLQEVFGLAEREDVLDEMRCWLLRSVSKSMGTIVGRQAYLTVQCSRATCT